MNQLLKILTKWICWIATLLVLPMFAVAQIEISASVYPLSEEQFEEIPLEKDVCYLESQDMGKAFEKGFRVKELAIVELNAPYPGVPSLDPFIFEGKKRIKRLGGNAFAIENSLEYSNSKKTSDVVLKAYRITDDEGEVSYLCHLGNWELAGNLLKLLKTNKAKANLSKTPYAYAEADVGLLGIYDCATDLFNKNNSGKKDEFPVATSLLASTQTFTDCLRVLGGRTGAENDKCGMNSTQFAVELSSASVDLRECVRTPVCDALNFYRKSHQEEYSQYANEYFRLYEVYPECDKRRKLKVSPVKNNAKQQQKKKV